MLPTFRPPATRTRVWPAVLVLTMLVGCARDEPAATATAPAPPPAVGPRETLQAMRAAHAERRYEDVRERIVPEQRHQVIETLLAIDTFLDANRRLCEWIRDHVGIGLAQTIDQSYLGENLGVFSPHVNLLDESVSGGQARVAFTVGQRLPTREARLRKVYGQWCYDPEAGYSERLPAAFVEMADGLDSVLAELRAGRIAKDELRDSPQALVEKVQARLRRGVSLLSQARQEADVERESP